MHIIPMIQSLETEKTTLADELTKVRDDLTQRESMIQSLETEKTTLADELTKVRDDLTQRESMIQSLETEKTTLADELTKVRDDLTQRESMIQSLETEKTRLTDELSCIRHSVGYKFMRFYGPKVDSIFPENTRRGEMKKIVATSLRVISDEGMRSFLSQALAKIRRREFRIVEPAPHYGKSEVELIPPS